MRRLAALLMMGFTAAAAARDAEGLLSVLQAPNAGTPAVVVPGGSFEAVALEQAPLQLVSDSDTHALAPQWHELPDGAHRAVCAVPADTAPRAYALQAGEDGQADINRRSVYVVATLPTGYQAAHVSAPRIGSIRHKRPAGDIFGEVIGAVNASGAAVALITGDLTEHGQSDELRRFLDCLNTCTIPTFVSPGPRDGALGIRAFGQSARVFRYGEDGYLAFGGRDVRISGELGPEEAVVHRLRRLIKPCRWSIGLCDSLGPGTGMRTHVTLFLDDPLSHVFCGRRGSAPEEGAVLPWGTAPVTETPPSLDGFIRLFEVTPDSIVPGDPRRVVEVK